MGGGTIAVAKARETVRASTSPATQSRFMATVNRLDITCAAGHIDGPRTQQACHGPTSEHWRIDAVTPRWGVGPSVTEIPTRTRRCAGDFSSTILRHPGRGLSAGLARTGAVLSARPLTPATAG